MGEGAVGFGDPGISTIPIFFLEPKKEPEKNMFPKEWWEEEFVCFFSTSTTQRGMGYPPGKFNIMGT